MITAGEQAAFADVVSALTDVDFPGNGIGTYNEKTTHRVLKFFFEPDEAFHEVPVGAYVADIRRDNRITEIQTSGFGAIRERLDFFLRSHEVTLVCPVYALKRIVWVDPETGLGERSVLSPKRGNVMHLLPEFGRLGDLFFSDSLCVKCVLLEGTEYRLKDGWGNGGKRGAHRLDRIPCRLADIVSVSNTDELRALMPFRAGDTFTSKDFATACGFSRKSTRDISMALRFLEKAGVTERAGKNGRAVVYRVR